MEARIKFKDGPLKGKTYLVPPGTHRHAVAGGHYVIESNSSKWVPDSKKPSRTAGAVAKADEVKEVSTASDGTP